MVFIFPATEVDGIGPGDPLIVRGGNRTTDRQTEGRTDGQKEKEIYGTCQFS